MTFSKLIIFGIAILSSGCSEFIQPSYGPTKDFSIDNMSTEEIKFNTSLYIENQNKYGFKVKTKNMYVYADGKKIASVNLGEKVKIKRKSGQDYRFNIEVKLIKGVSLAGIGASSMLTNRPINVSVKGKVRGSKFFFGKSVPIEFEKKINPKQLLNLKGSGLGF